jgi:hypothetical protein
VSRSGGDRSVSSGARANGGDSGARSSGGDPALRTSTPADATETDARPAQRIDGERQRR